MPTWLYVLLCLAVPSVWGVAMYFVFELVARRRQLGDGRDKTPPVDYSI